MLTAIVDAKEERDVMSGDVPNAFIQAQMPDLDKGAERVIMKITGVLVDLIVQMAPEVYGSFVTGKGGSKVLVRASTTCIVWHAHCSIAMV